MSKLLNEYAEVVRSMYEDTPKAVFAAIAVSAMTVGGDEISAGTAARLVTEWDVLHTNGIVPQSVPSSLRHLIGMADAIDAHERAIDAQQNDPQYHRNLLGRYSD